MGFGCKVYTSARRLWEPRPGPREMPKPGLFPIDTQKRTGSTLSRISSFVSLARSTIFKTYPDGGIGCHRHSQSFRLYHQKERRSWQFSGILTVNGIAASSFCCLHSGFVHNAQIRWKAAIFLFVGSLQRFPPSIDIEQVLESFWLVFHRISLRRFARLWPMGSLLRLPDFVSIFRGPEPEKIDMVGAKVTSRSALLVAGT